MAKKIEVVVKPILIPNGSINGEKHYSDYGWKWMWIYNMDNDPPTIIKSGVTTSGRLEISIDGTCSTMQQELPPEIRDMPFRRDEEPFGMVAV